MTDEEDFIVLVQDCRKLGFCMKQVRPWFPKMGLDFRDFIKNGIPASKLLATNDSYAARVVEEARKRIKG